METAKQSPDTSSGEPSLKDLLFGTPRKTVETVVTALNVAVVIGVTAGVVNEICREEQLYAPLALAHFANNANEGPKNIEVVSIATLQDNLSSFLVPGEANTLTLTNCLLTQVGVFSEALHYVAQYSIQDASGEGKPIPLNVRLENLQAELPLATNGVSSITAHFALYERPAPIPAILFGAMAQRDFVYQIDLLNDSGFDK